MGGWTGTGNIDLDPRFVDPANGDFTLLAESPCINTGDPNSPLDPDAPLQIWVLIITITHRTSMSQDCNTLMIFCKITLTRLIQSTTIRFSISEFGFTKLTIYDILGNEIESLVNEELPAGEYEVEFNTSTINHNHLPEFISIS